MAATGALPGDPGNARGDRLRVALTADDGSSLTVEPRAGTIWSAGRSPACRAHAGPGATGHALSFMPKRPPGGRKAQHLDAKTRAMGSGRLRARREGPG